MNSNPTHTLPSTCFVYRAVQRDKPWDQFLGPFAPKRRRPSLLPRLNQAAHVPDSGTSFNSETAVHHHEDSSALLEWDTASVAVSVASDWLTSDDSDGESLFAYEDGEFDCKFPQGLEAHYLLRPYNPNGNLTGQEHILSRWEPHTNSPWISLTLSLEYGVFYQAMTTFMSTHERTNLACQANTRDLYAMEVPRDELYKFEIPSTFADVQLDETMAEIFSRTARERLAARELTVYRYERVRIPDQVEEIAHGWFAERASVSGWTFPFRQWRQFMYDQCPQWFDLIVDPVAKWEMDRDDDWTEDRLSLALE